MRPTIAFCTAVLGLAAASVQAQGAQEGPADRSGTFTYACTFHPTMKGTLEVQ